MRLLDGEEAQSMFEHAQRCEDCGQEIKRARLQHADLIRCHDDFDRDHDVLRQQLMAALSSEQVVPNSTGTIRGHIRTLGATLMNIRLHSPGRAVAALLPAASILIVAIVYFMPSDQEVLASALSRLREAESIVCQVTMTMKASFQAVDETQELDVAELNDRPDLTYVRREHLYINPAYGLKREAFSDDTLVSTTYARPDGSTVVLNHAERTYDSFDSESEPAMPEAISDALRELLAERPLPEFHLIGLSSSPDRLIKSLQNLTLDADRELGRRMIDGREAIGFEISGEKVGFGPPFFENTEDIHVEVWVDAESAAPARLVLHFTWTLSQISDIPIVPTYDVEAVYDQFELDVPLAAEIFEPVIPDDYKPGSFTQQQRSVLAEEADMIEALRVFAENAGRYPESLQLMDLTYEVSYLMGSLQAQRLVAKREGKDVGDLPDIQVIGQELQGLIYFAMLETSGRKPEYAGESVKPGDEESVLLRWVLEDGRERVVYGDLQVETIP